VLHVPRVYAFDLDPAFDLGANRASGPGGGASPVGGEVGLATTAGTHYMHQRTGFAVELEDSEQPHDVPNLFRISDHRPLSLDLRV
jgi:hypothetical protein